MFAFENGALSRAHPTCLNICRRNIFLLFEFLSHLFFFHLQPFFWLCFSYTLLLYYCSLSHIYLYYYFYLFASSLVRLYTFLFVTITYYFSIVQDFSLAFPFGFRCLTRSSNREIKPERGRKHPKTKDGGDFPMPFHAVRYVRLVAACTVHRLGKRTAQCLRGCESSLNYLCHEHGGIYPIQRAVCKPRRHNVKLHWIVIIKGTCKRMEHLYKITNVTSTAAG